MLISGTAYDQLPGKLDLRSSTSGEQRLKNIARPVRAYRMALDGARPMARLAAVPHATSPRWRSCRSTT